MREFIIENLTSSQSLDIYIVIVNNIVALALSFFLMFTYKITYSGTAYSRKFNISLGMITLITTMVMCLISSNIALSLGMVGALSIIRFRTAVKDVRDAVFIFWCIAVGIGCGISQYVLVSISTIIIVLFLIIMRQVVPENRQLLIIRGELNSQNKIEAVVSSYFNKKAHQTMKNATKEYCEFVYSISTGELNKAKEKNLIDITEAVSKVEGVTNINVVEQLDDIGR